MTPRVDALRAQLTPDSKLSGALGLDEYQIMAARTDKSGLHGRAALSFLLLGLFGEVGSLLSELKKKQRDKNAYFAYATTASEELGDVLWYFASSARQAGLKLSEIAAAAAALAEGEAMGRSYHVHSFRDLQRQDRLFSHPASGPLVGEKLLRLASRAGRLVEDFQAGLQSDLAVPLATVFQALVDAADDAEVNLDLAAMSNLEKALGRWPLKDASWGRPLDDDIKDMDERLPSSIEMIFKEKGPPEKRYVLQQWKGVNIGDRLTDNRLEQDHYRFHDVFHLSYAAFLGWSPVLRALLKIKRKSVPAIDDHQDGARAIITEEGISNWIFAHGQRHEAFEGVESVDFALLKTIREMVKGYEVQDRPLWMWERAILEGFRVFRLLRDNGGGLVIADLSGHRLTWSPAPASN